MSHLLQLLINLDVHMWMAIETLLEDQMIILKEAMARVEDQDDLPFTALDQEYGRIQDAVLKIREAIDFYYGPPPEEDQDVPEMLDSWTYIRS